MLKYWIGRAWMRFFGWRVVGETEIPDRCVFIAAPHTSNWDLPFMLGTAWTLRVRISWLGKHSLFKPPFGWFFRWMGGVPVDRRSPQNLVAQVVEQFGARPYFILAVPPEGTRGKVEHWKSGFYHIARGADVPIGLGFLDYARKQSGLGKLVHPTGDVAADMDAIRAFYADVKGRFPEKQSVPRLREEDAAEALRARG